MTVLEALGEPADVVISIDFETYYDSEYSLSKLTTEAYVRDYRFQVIGVGVKVGAGSAVWLEEREFREWASQVDWSRVAVLCHHTHFDGAILAWCYGIKPAIWLDTLSLARGLHGIEVGGSLKKLATYYGVGEKGDEVEKVIGKRRADFSLEEWERYGYYCCNDVDLTYALFWQLVIRTPEQELWVIDTTIRCFTEPSFELNESMMRESLENERARKTALLERIEADRDVLLSNDKFAGKLVDLGVDPPRKKSPTHKCKYVCPKADKPKHKCKPKHVCSVPCSKLTTYAFAKTDPAMKGLLEHETDEVRWLAEARIGIKSTITESRTERFLDIATRGALPVYLRYCGAHTGRWSGAEKTNFQNLNRGGVIRDALQAPEGDEFVAMDSSQIEARVLAWFAGHVRLVEAFAQGRDTYSEFATIAYGRPVDRRRKLADGTKPDEEAGNVGKTCILSLGYGAGWKKLAIAMLAGPMGAKPIRFGEAEVEALGVNVQRFEFEHGDAVSALPSRLPYEDMLIHCAVSKALVDLYRDENAPIPKLWRDMDAILHAMSVGLEMKFGPGGICQTVSEGIILPSGRRLRYPGLHLTEDGYVYRGSRSKTEWTKIYGAALVENITQALARDIIAEQMLWMRAEGRPIVTTTHDELVTRTRAADAPAAAKRVKEIMSTPPAWALGVPLAASGGHATTYGGAK